VESALIAIAIILMVLSLFASMIPFMPGSVLVWLVGVVFAIIDGFDRVTYVSIAIMTLFMIIGATSGLWMQALGVKRQGGSCLTSLGSLLGGMLGTWAIPVPILGTLTGAIVGALLVEFLRVGELKQALQAGHTAFKLYVVGVAVEFTAGFAILLVFVISVWLTG